MAETPERKTRVRVNFAAHVGWEHRIQVFGRGYRDIDPLERNFFKDDKRYVLEPFEVISKPYSLLKQGCRAALQGRLRTSLCSANTRFRSTCAGDAAVGELWHHRKGIVLLRIVLRLLADVAGLIALSGRPRRAIEAENLVLRRQLALFKERGIKARRVDAATRVSLALLSRLFDWRDALVLVRPETLIGWHRAGWRLFWRWKARPGRPPIPLELRQLIRRMATENPLWGEQRLANELLLKLGLRISPRTVRK